MTTYVDTCVLIDVLDETSPDHATSIQKLDEAKIKGPVLVSDAVYSEFSVAMATVEEVDGIIEGLDLVRYSYTNLDLFAAGKAFAAYRENQGLKTNVLPDFFIGASAHNSGSPLITRDTGKITTYFPNVDIIDPSQ